MFQNAFQSGTHLEIFHHKIDKEKEKKLFRVTNPSSLSKVFDRTTRGYIYDLDRGLKPSLHFPASDKQDLGIIQPFLTFQAYFPAGEHFTIEITITNTTKSKRRFHFSTTTKQLELTYFHARIPLDIVKRDTWINLSFDMMSFLELFKGQTFRTIDAFSIGGVCKIRRIFTLKQFPNDLSLANEDLAIPKAQNFGPGVPHSNQLLTLDMIKNQQIPDNIPIQESNNLEIVGMGFAPLAENRNLKLQINHRRVRSSAKDVVNNSVELPLPSQRIFRNQRNSVVDKENIRQNVPISSAAKPRAIKPIVPIRHSVQNFIRIPSIDDIDLLDINDEMEWKNVPTPINKEEKLDPLQEIQIEATPKNNFSKEEEKSLKTEESNEKSQKKRSMKEIPKSALFERFLNRKTETSNLSINSSHFKDQEISVESIPVEPERPSYEEKKKDIQPPRINKWFQNLEVKTEETPVKIEERRINTAEKKAKDEENFASKNGFFSERGAFITNKLIKIDYDEPQKERRLPSVWENVLGGFIPTPKGNFSIPPLIQESPKMKVIEIKNNDKSIEELNWESSHQEEERFQVEAPEIASFVSEGEDSCIKALSLNEDEENEPYDASENSLIPLQVVEKSAYLEPEIVEQEKNSESDDENVPYETDKEEQENINISQQEDPLDSSGSDLHEETTEDKLILFHESGAKEARNLSQRDVKELKEEWLDSRGSEIQEGKSEEKLRFSFRSGQKEIEDLLERNDIESQEESLDSLDSLDSRGSDIQEEKSEEKLRLSYHSDHQQVRNPFEENDREFPEESPDSRGSDTQEEQSEEKPRYSHQSGQTAWYSVKSDFGGWSTQRKIMTRSVKKQEESDRKSYEKEIFIEEKKEDLQSREDFEAEEDDDKSSALNDSLEFMISKYVHTGAEGEIIEGKEAEKNPTKTFRLEKEDFRSPPLGPSMVDDEFSYQGMGDSSESDDERDENFGKGLDETDFGIMKTLKEVEKTEGLEEVIGGGEMEVVYDPVWKCYYHPKTNSYFELK